MTELFDFDVTPSRLGEMYVNTIVNTADLLLAHEYAMAAQARTAPDALLAPVPRMTRKHLLAFINGATQQCRHFLDTLTPDPSTRQQNAARDHVHDSTHGSGSYADQVDHAIDLIGDPLTRDDGYTRLGACESSIQDLVSSPDLAHHTRDALTGLRQRIDAVLDEATTHDLIRFISGTRREQASDDAEGVHRSNQ